MGFEYFKRPLQVISSTSDFQGSVGFNGLSLDTQAFTAGDASQTLSAGFNVLTGATDGGGDFNLPAPRGSGEVKIVVALPSSDTLLSIHANATAAASNFFGTTCNTVTVATTATSLLQGTPMFLAVGVSTAQWALALLSGSSDTWTFSNTTGSTGDD